MTLSRPVCLAIAAALFPSLALAADDAAAPLPAGSGTMTAAAPKDPVPGGLTLMFSKTSAQVFGLSLGDRVWDKAKADSMWTARFYGFVEADAINDSTQSYTDTAGSTVIATPGSYAADHGRLQFGVRNSRVGLEIAGPRIFGIKASGLVEGDFEGNQNTVGNPTPSVSNTPSDNTEAAYYNNPAFRLRNGYLKLESPIIDLLAGQYWELFGWQTVFQPNTVEIQGVPGEVYSRTAQFRLSHTFKTEMLNVDAAVAALRPVQRDSDVPDIQAGLKFTLNKWKGWHTVGATGSQLDGLQLGVSGLYRHFAVEDFTASCTATTCSAKQTSVQTTNGWGVSVDALIPIIPASATSHANALTLTGSFADGSGDADQYTSLTGGMSFPALSLPTGTTGTSPTYSPNIDNGFVTYGTNGKLSAIDWMSFIVGVQYYLPFETVWVSANFSQTTSSNDESLVATGGLAKIVQKFQWADANIFWDATSQARLGLEYARFNQAYGNGANTFNNRVQLSAFYIF